MENEVMLKCEGSNNEGRVCHAVLDVRMTVLRDTKTPVDSMTQVLSQARKITCAEVRRVRGFCAVTLGLKDRNITDHPNLMPATICRMIATTTKTSLMRLQKNTISIWFSGRLVQFLHCGGRRVDLVVVELVH